MLSRISRVKLTLIVLLLLLAALLLGLLLRNTYKLPRSSSSTPSESSTYKAPWSPSNIVYGVNVDISAMIPGTGYNVRTASGGNFFDLATQLGINTIRITDIQWASTGQIRSQAIWQTVFDEAKNHHMNIVLLLIDGGEHSAIQEAHILLDDYGLAHAQALWLVDLDNEPNLSDPQQMAQLRQEATYVHRVAPNVPVTIGGWKSEGKVNSQQFDWQDPADIPKLIDLVDVVSPHLYGFEKAAQSGITPQQWTQRFLSAVRQQSHGKPILIEEFGEGNGLATTTESTPTGSPQLQAFVYRSVLKEVTDEHDQGVIGAVAWIIAPRPVWPNSNSLQGDMSGWAFVLNHGQYILPAANAFSAVENAKQSN